MAFFVLLGGALLNVHFFQSDSRGRQISRLEKPRVEVKRPAKSHIAHGRVGDDQWRARLRRRGETEVGAIGATGRRRSAYIDVAPKANLKTNPVLKSSPKPTTVAKVQAQTAGGVSKLVRAVQRELTSRGYEPGPVDGVEGLMTRAAIMAFQHDRGIAISGRATEPLLKRLVLGGSLLAMPDTETGQGVENRRKIIMTVQLRLKKLGYKPGAANGLMSIRTRDAIKEFEKYSGLVETGRVSGRLIGKLQPAQNMLMGSSSGSVW